jgi:hypothetical protein
MNNLKTLAITAAISLFFASCEKNESTNLTDDSAAKISLSGVQTHEDCGFIDNNWPSSAVLSTTNIVNSSETNFIFGQNADIASLFQINTVPLGFAIGSGTFNAISYGAGYIIFGETLYNYALNNGGRIAVAYVQAHEVAHQLQFRNGLPSRNENTARAAELEADAFGGFYIGHANGYAADWTAASNAYNFAAGLGDNNVNSPGHHGTAAQRRSAFRLGWLLRNNQYPGARNFDSAFFRYYDQYVLAGALRGEFIRPEGISQDTHEYIMSKMEELHKISTGEISEEEFVNLQ